MRIIVEDKQVKNIPVLDVYNLDLKEKLPIIFMLHGLTGYKETGLKNAYKFARQGFYVVLFDAYRHGELADEEFKKLNYYEKTLETTDIILETTKYLNALINYYSFIENADINRCGLIGFSMGGCIVYNFLADKNNPKVKAAIPVIGSPMSGKPLRELLESSPDTINYIDEAKVAYAERKAPYRRLKGLKDLPLLMLNGEKDHIFAIADIRDCYKQWSKNYDHQEMIKKVEFNVGHEVTEEMIDMASEWFHKYL